MCPRTTLCRLCLGVVALICGIPVSEENKHGFQHCKTDRFCSRSFSVRIYGRKLSQISAICPGTTNTAKTRYFPPAWHCARRVLSCKIPKLDGVMTRIGIGRDTKMMDCGRWDSTFLLWTHKNRNHEVILPCLLLSSTMQLAQCQCWEA